MSRRALLWGGVGLLALVILLIGLVVNRSRPGEATFSAARPQSTSPALLAATQGIPVQTSALQMASPNVASPTATRTPFPTAETPAPTFTMPATPTIPPATAPIAVLPSPSPGSTAIGSPTSTRVPADTPVLTPALPSRPAVTATSRPESTATASPTDLPTSLPAITVTSRPTFTPRPTVTPLAPGINGRLLLGGQPAAAGTLLVLEDQSLNIVAETTLGADGRYRFANVPVSVDGYNVTFSWERNPTYGLDEVIAWGWIGPVAYADQEAIQLPDLEIGLLGLEHIQPEPDTIHSAAAISAGTPLTFVWDQHPAASQYWVDLLAAPALERVWRSPFTPTTSIDFSGRLDDGRHIPPGQYWWAVGGQRVRDGYPITVYGQLAGLSITS